MSLLFKQPSTLLIVVLIILVTNCFANSSVVNFDKNPERGWYFYEKKKDPTLFLFNSPQINASNNQKQNKKIDSCQDPKKWTVECGFIDPTTHNLSSDQAFAFEQKQYKGLMRNYALYPNNLDAVYNFQKFNMWVLNQAMTAAYTWQYNLAQHPDIDANIQVPVSQFGMQLIKNIEQDSEKDFWKTLAKTAFFVLVTRTDNKFCQGQGTIMHLLERETGMTVWNFSVDDKHLSGFDHYMNYSKLPKAKQETIARYLKMDWLPTIYLYMKPIQENDTGHWIRVTSGITTLDEIKERTIHFVEAYKHAIIEGVGENQKIRPDFSVNHLYQLAGEKLNINKNANRKEKSI